MPWHVIKVYHVTVVLDAINTHTHKKKFFISNSSTLRSDGKPISRILSYTVGATGATAAQGTKTAGGVWEWTGGKVR